MGGSSSVARKYAKQEVEEELEEERVEVIQRPLTRGAVGIRDEEEPPPVDEPESYPVDMDFLDDVRFCDDTRFSTYLRMYICASPDMHHELRVLHSQVFPKILSLCLQRGVHFQPVDLRFGLRREEIAVLSVDLCRREIRRCQRVSFEGALSFIALLGDNYGTPALPSAFLEKDFKVLRAAGFRNETEQYLCAVYQYDENAVPPVYRRSLGVDLDAAVKDINVSWTDLQLLYRLQNAAMSSRKALTPTCVSSLTTSLVAHEVVAGLAHLPDGAAIFLRSVKGVPIRHPASRVYLNLKPTDDDKMEIDVEASTAMSDLKKQVLKELPRSCKYQVPWGSNDIELDHLLKFRLDIEKAIARSVDRFMQRLSRKGGFPSLLSQETQHHQYIVRQCCEHVAGQSHIIEKIMAYIDNKSSRHPPLVVMCPPGSGMKGLASAIGHRLSTQPRVLPVVRFCGTSLSSRDGCSLIHSILEEISVGYSDLVPDLGLLHTPNKSCFLSLATSLDETFKSVTSDRAVVLFIVGANNFENDPAGRMCWMPSDLPEYVHVVFFLSTAHAEHPTWLYIKRHSPKAVLLQTQLPAMSFLELALSVRMTACRRTLRDKQKQGILTATQRSGQMRYLVMCARFASDWFSRDNLKILPVLPTDLFLTIFRDRVARVKTLMLPELFLGFEGLLWQVMGFIHCSLTGLSELEILELIGNCLPVSLLDQLYPLRHLQASFKLIAPFQLWSWIHFALSPFLQETYYHGHLLLTLPHRAVRGTLDDRLMGGKKAEVHATLATLFLNSPTHYDRSSNHRRLCELPYQIINARQFNLLEQLFCDFDFLQMKVSGDGPYALIADCNLAQSVFSAGGATIATRSLVFVQQWGRFLSERARQLHKTPLVLFQECMNYFPDSGPITVARSYTNSQVHSAVSVPPCWIRWHNKPQHDDAKLFTVHAHQFGVTSVLLLSSREWIITGGGDGHIIIWHLATGEHVASLGSHFQAVTALAFDPLSGRLVSCSEDRSLKVWDLASMSFLGQLDGHTKRLTCASVLWDSLVVSGSDDSTLIVWDTNTMREQVTLRGHSDTVTCVTSHQTVEFEDVIVSGSGDRTIRLWKLTDLTKPSVLRGHRMWISSICFSTQTGFLFSASFDGTIRIWDTTRLTCIGSHSCHKGRVSSICYCELTSTLFSCGSDEEVKMWVDAGEDLRFQGRVACVASVMDVNDKGQKLVACDTEMNMLHVPSIQTEAYNPARHYASITALAQPTKGRHVASGCDAGIVKLWKLGFEVAIALEWEVRGHKGVVTSLVFSNTGENVFSASEDRTIKKWTLLGEAVMVFLGQHSGITSLAHYTAGSFLLSGASDGSVFLWETNHTRVFLKFQGHPMHPIATMSMKGDGLHIVTTAKDRKLKVWSVNDSSLALEKEVPTTDVLGIVALSPLGKQFVTLHANNCRIEVWEAREVKVVSRLQGHKLPVTAVSFSADGTLLLSASLDNTIRVWNISTQLAIATYATLSPVQALYATGSTWPLFVAGDAKGHLLVLRVVGVSDGSAGTRPATGGGDLVPGEGEEMESAVVAEDAGDGSSSGGLETNVEVEAAA